MWAEKTAEYTGEMGRVGFDQASGLVHLHVTQDSIVQSCLKQKKPPASLHCLHCQNRPAGTKRGWGQLTREGDSCQAVLHKACHKLLCQVRAKFYTNMPQNAKVIRFTCNDTQSQVFIRDQMGFTKKDKGFQNEARESGDLWGTQQRKTGGPVLFLAWTFGLVRGAVALLHKSTPVIPTNKERKTARQHHLRQPTT